MSTESDPGNSKRVAAITPVTDEANVYVFFKDYGLISYSAEGKLRWRVSLGPFKNAQGLAAAPILAGGRLIHT